MSPCCPCCLPAHCGPVGAEGSPAQQQTGRPGRRSATRHGRTRFQAIIQMTSHFLTGLLRGRSDQPLDAFTNTPTNSNHYYGSVGGQSHPNNAYTHVLHVTKATQACTQPTRASVPGILSSRLTLKLERGSAVRSAVSKSISLLAARARSASTQSSAYASCCL